MMHKVLHNFGDWELDTRHMTRIEKSIYFDMRTLYLKDGKPLTDDLPLLERLLSCHSDDEKQALVFVISHKFTHDKKRHAYRHKEWDLILKNYKFRHKGTDNDGTHDGTDYGTHDGTDYGTHDGTDYGTHDRKKAFRERQKSLIDLLKAHGIQANSRMGYKELLALCKQHGIDVMQDNDGTHDGTNTQTTDNDGQKNGTKNQAITINHKPITINQEPNNISPQTPQGAGVGDDTAGTHETTKETTQKTYPSPKADETLNVPFETFWDSYDKKISPEKCRTLWKRLSNKERLDIMAYLPKYKQAQPDKKYRKHPQTFLNNRSWEDEIIDSTPKPTWQPPQPQPAHNNQTTFDEHGNIITAGASYENHQTNHRPNNQPVKRNSQAEYELIREQRHRDLRAMGYDI